MNIVCVYSITTYSLKKELYSPGDIPFGISFVATVLKKAGHNVKLVVITPTTSPDSIIEEIKQLIEFDPNVETVFLETETLGANLKYTHHLLERLTEFNRSIKKPLKFGTNVALTTQIQHNRDLLQAFKDANLVFFRIGLESGSEKVRRDVLNRPKYSNKDLIEFCSLAREFDVKYTINILIGLPGETRADFQETIDVTRQCRPTFGVAASIFFPYPGTKLYDVCKKQNLLQSQAGTTFFERTATVLDLPDFSPWQVKNELILIYYKVYRGYKPWPDIALKTLLSAIQTFPWIKRSISKIMHPCYSFAIR